MLLSMTGYGRSLVLTKSGPLEIEIHSINRKALDVNIQIPRELLYLDVEMRHFVSEFIERGQVTLRLTQRASGGVPSFEQLQQVKETWEMMAKKLGLKEELTLSFLASQLTQFSSVQNMTFEDLRPGLEEAMKGLMGMKQTEGAALEKEFTKCLDAMSHHIDDMAPLVTKSAEIYRDKLTQRLLDLEVKGDPDRLLLEITLFIDRADITEELARLMSHIEQFRSGLQKKTAGRELNFLLQEMIREITTILSKSQDLALTKIALAVKSSIETMKEQVANIE